MALPDLSRDCIRDTLMYKRELQQWNAPGDFARALYNLSIRRLRAGQLAPHQEHKMRKGRYLELQAVKRSAPEIIVVVRAGHIKQVCSTNPFTLVQIVDYEAVCDDSKAYSAMCAAEERGLESDMYAVYEN